MTAGAGAAHGRQGGCGVPRAASVGTLDEWSWKQLDAVYEIVSEERYDEAFEDASNMLRRAGPDAYLQAVLNQVLGQIEWARGHIEEALVYLESAVSLDALPDAAHYTSLYQAAQIYFMEDHLDEALERLELWFCAMAPDRITAAAWVLKASILVQQRQYAGALEAIDAAIAMDENPREPWYQVKLAAHYELEQYPQAAETLRTLIARWPDRKHYWTELAQTLYALKQDQQALAVQALAYRKGLLDEQADLTFLTSLYSNLHLPYQAAEVLERGIREGILQGGTDQWTLVADAWYAAGELERSLAAYAQAGKAAAHGRVDLRRGYLLVDLERWPAALEALDRALIKGGLDQRQAGEAYLLRGVAKFNLGNLEDASADWHQAEHFEATGDAARQWMSYLQEERRRRAS